METIHECMLTLKSVVYDDRIKHLQLAKKEAPHQTMIFVTSGLATYWLNGTEISLIKGDVLYIPSGEAVGFNVNGQHKHQKYSVHFSSEAKPDQSLTALFSTSDYFKCHMRNFDYFKQRCSMLLQQWSDPSPGHHMICQGILLELIGLILKNAEEPQHTSASIKKQYFISQLQNYIVNNCDKSIRLTDLADYIERSPNYVTKIFKDVLDQSPIEYIHQVKIAKAFELLQMNSMSVADISDHLGYCELSYFHRIFKKFTGVTPSYVQNAVKTENTAAVQR
ncbi:helix-turn-helix domain-containing protein [Paenibacillus sp. GCM10027626]|uniref:helix-turn-helix domain-containing protein n=1 Tax=Paenibacillus sp. GCM10027626 TaxID=3273411 RepID=UPI00362D7414